jgi:hypothetical protein
MLTQNLLHGRHDTLVICRPTTHDVSLGHKVILLTQLVQRHEQPSSNAPQTETTLSPQLEEIVRKDLLSVDVR